MWKGELRIEIVKGCNFVSFEQPASKRPYHCLFRQELLQNEQNIGVSISAKKSYGKELRQKQTEITICRSKYCRNQEKIAKGKNKCSVASSIFSKVLMLLESSTQIIFRTEVVYSALWVKQ